MSTDDTDALSTHLLRAKKRDVRRATIIMVMLMVIMMTGSVLWIADLTRSRDSWREDSRGAWGAHAELSQKYSDLYDEFVEETGHLPFAEAPSEATDSEKNSDDGDSDALEGETGPPGATGPVGPTGPRGEPGLRGVAGKDGKDGADGRDGATGATGEQGPQGEPGAAGPIGPTGPKGVTGDRGPQGEQGPKGDTGPMGPNGATGKDGRGIADLVCDPDTGKWIVTWTTGQSESVGTCTAQTTPSTGDESPPGA